MKSCRDLLRENFSLRRSKKRLEHKNEELTERNEKLEETLEVLKDLIQNHLPTRNEFFLWQEGRGRKI